MRNMKRAMGIVLVVSVAGAPCSLGAEDIGGGGSSLPPADVVSRAAANEQDMAGSLSTRMATEEAATRHLDSEPLRSGLRMLSDEQLGALAARAAAAPAASSGGGGSKKKTLIIVGAAAIVAVLLVVSIRDSCKKQGPDCFK